MSPSSEPAPRADEDRDNPAPPDAWIAAGQALRPTLSTALCNALFCPDLPGRFPTRIEVVKC